MTAQEQRLAALEIANQRRFARAAVRRHLRTAPNRAEAWRRLADILDDGITDEAADLTIHDLLATCRRTGPHAVEVLLAITGCSSRRTAGRIRPDERVRLVAALRTGDLKAARQRLFPSTRSTTS